MVKKVKGSPLHDVDKIKIGSQLTTKSMQTQFGSIQVPSIECKISCESVP